MQHVLVQNLVELAKIVNIVSIVIRVKGAVVCVVKLFMKFKKLNLQLKSISNQKKHYYRYFINGDWKKFGRWVAYGFMWDNCFNCSDIRQKKIKNSRFLCVEYINE
jgi:hypothetical protein